MLERDRNIESWIFLIYFLLSIFMLVLYPFWIVVQDSTKKIGFFVFLVLLVIVTNFILAKKLKIYKGNDTKVKSNLKEHKWLFIVLFIALIAQIPFLFMPLTSYSDEISHVSTGMYLEKAISYATHGYSWVLLLLGVGALFWFFRKRSYFNHFIKDRFIILAIVFIPLSIAYFYLVNDLFISYASQYAQQTLAQKAARLLSGLRGIVFSIPLMAFGYREFAVRLPSLIAYLLSAVVLYLLVLENGKSKRTALYSAAILLFFPGFFYYGNLAYDVPILTLAYISSIYLIMKYWKTTEFKFVFFSFLIAALATLFEKKGAFIWLALAIIVIARHLIIEKNINLTNFKHYLSAGLLAAVLFLPQFIMNYFSFSGEIEEVHSSSLFLFGNLFDAGKLALNFTSIPYIVSILGAAFLFFGIIYSLYKAGKKDVFNLTLICFLIVYGLIILAYRFTGLPRLLVPLTFIFAIMIAQVLVLIEGRHFNAKYISYVFVAFLFISTLYVAVHNYEDRYLPMDNLFRYIEEQTPADAKFIKSMAPSSYNFYIFKHDLNFNNFDPTIWQPAESQTVENLYAYMKKTNATYVFFPLPTSSYDIFFYKPNPSTWLDLWEVSDNEIKPLINHKIVEDIYNNKNNLFTKEAEFASGKNVLFIAKIK